MPTKGVLKDKKISNKHQTLILEAEPIVRQAKALSEVTKIVVGHIKHIRGGNPRVKYGTIQAGLIARVRGKSAVQTILIYTKEPRKVKAILERQ